MKTFSPLSVHFLSRGCCYSIGLLYVLFVHCILLKWKKGLKIINYLYTGGNSFVWYAAREFGLKLALFLPIFFFACHSVFGNNLKVCGTMKSRYRRKTLKDEATVSNFWFSVLASNSGNRSIIELLSIYNTVSNITWEQWCSNNTSWPEESIVG